MNILYIAPIEKERTGVARYSEIFESVVSGGGSDEGIRFVHFKRSPLKGVLRDLGKIKEDVSAINERPDIIHAEMSSSTYIEFWYAFYICKRMKDVPLLLTIHDSPYVCLNPFLGFFSQGSAGMFSTFCRRFLDVSAGRYVGKLLAKRAKKVFVLTKSGASRFTERFPFAETVYLPQISFPETKGGHFSENGENIILFQGFVIKGKGIEILLQAFSEIVRKRRSMTSLKLLICGRYDKGPYFKKLLNIVETLGLGDRVDFKGFVGEGELEKYISKAIMVVFPYFIKKTYSSSAALLRALTHGKPVIVSDIDMLKENVKEGYNGLIFKAGDSRDLRVKMELFLCDATLRKKVSEGAREYVLKEHNDAEIKDMVLVIYRSQI